MSRITFIRPLLQVESQLCQYSPDVILVVLALDDKISLDQSELLLEYLRMKGLVGNIPVILVANKTDLVRGRVVKQTGSLKYHMYKYEY